MVFITGATGLLGSYIARYLVAEGVKVRALKRATSDLSLLGDAADKIEWVEGHLLDVPFLEQAMEGVDYVYHSAAKVSFAKKDHAAMHKVNIEGTANLVNICQAFDVKKMVHVSSIATFGKGKSDELINEDRQWDDSKLNSAYGLSKYKSELEVWRGMNEGLKAVIINPAFILGAGRWNDSSTRLFRRVNEGMGFYPAGGNGYVDVRDVAQIAIQLAKSDTTGERYVVSGHNKKYIEVIGSIAKALNKKPPTKQASDFMLKLSANLEMLKYHLTKKEPALTLELAPMLSLTYKYDNSKVREALNFEFRPFEQTINDVSQKMLESIAEDKDYATLAL